MSIDLPEKLFCLCGHDMAISAIVDGCKRLSCEGCGQDIAWHLAECWMDGCYSKLMTLRGTPSGRRATLRYFEEIYKEKRFNLDARYCIGVDSAEQYVSNRERLDAALEDKRQEFKQKGFFKKLREAIFGDTSL